MLEFESITNNIPTRRHPTLHVNGNFFMLLSTAHLFQNQLSKISFRYTTRVSNSLDPDQARHFVGPDLGPKTICKCYQQTTVAGKRDNGLFSAEVDNIVTMSSLEKCIFCFIGL